MLRTSASTVERVGVIESFRFGVRDLGSQCERAWYPWLEVHSPISSKLAKTKGTALTSIFFLVLILNYRFRRNREYL